MKVVVLQSNRAETTYWASDPANTEADGFRPIERIEELTPDGILLASLGSSTAQVLHTYARRHGLDLEHVELRLDYETLAVPDQPPQNTSGKKAGQVCKEIIFYGQLLPSEHEKLLQIADQCSIHRMLNSGLEISSRVQHEWRDD